MKSSEIFDEASLTLEKLLDAALSKLTNAPESEAFDIADESARKDAVGEENDISSRMMSRVHGTLSAAASSRLLSLRSKIRTSLNCTLNSKLSTILTA